jgi:glycosyltransferase involved in cell wall biosynthesis
VSALSEAMIAALSDPEAARAMGERGRQVASNEFSIPVVAGKLASLYQSILDRRLSVRREPL